jgi:stearoyl-CoA desaturase (delta-9 desaturase)
MSSALHGPELSALRQSLTRAHDRTTEVLMGLHLPHMPNREELTAKATAMFARTRSLEEIVDRAYELLLASVGTRLADRMASRP